MGGKIFGAVAALALAAWGNGALAAGSTGCSLGKLAEAPVTMQGRMPIVPVTINDKPVKVMADTGAFFSFLTPSAAGRLGLSKGSMPGGGYIRGVNGSESAQLTTAASIGVFGVTLKRPQFIVSAKAMDGVIDGVLGQNLLMLGDVELDLANGVIRIFKPAGCGKAWLAYWDREQQAATADRVRIPGMPVKAVIIKVRLNGVLLNAEIDTGSGASLVSASAARRAGSKLSGDGNVSVGDLHGIGTKVIGGWTAPFDSFEFGEERIGNTRIEVAEMNLEGIDMLLGTDFLLSHRVMISESQNRVYATYLGGPVFRIDQAATSPPPAPAAEASDANQPQTADAFGRRGAARLTRHDREGAIADLSRAIELAPTNADYRHQRARAYAQIDKQDLALKDLDVAVGLAPEDISLRLDRGSALLSKGDLAAAKADFAVALDRDPASALRVSSIYIDAKRFADAQALLDAWIDSHPKDGRLVGALNDRCWLRGLWNHDLEQGLDDCNRALRLAPRVQAIRDSRGLINLRLGRWADAIADYDSSMTTGQRGISLYGRGMAKLGAGQVAEGQADIAAAKAIDPRLMGMVNYFGLPKPDPAASPHPATVH